MAWLNGKEGVWRTVGGRKIFIATGQSLKDAMKASGKFKNLNDNKEKLEKIIQKDKEEGKVGERLKKIEDAERYDRLYDKYKESGMSDEKIKNLLGEKPKTGLELNDKDYIDIPGFKDYEYNTKTGEVKVKDDVLKEANRQNRLREEKENSPATKSINALNEIDRIAGDDTFLQKKGRELGLNEFKKYMEGKPGDFIKRKNKEQSINNDTSKFTMVNDSGKTVTVTKSDMDGKWYDSDGNKYMGYLSKSDVMSYFKGSFKEVKNNSDSSTNQLNKTMDNRTQIARALDLEIDEPWKSMKQLYKEQKGIDLAEKAINSGKAGDYLKLRDRVDSELMENTFDYERNFNNMYSIKKYAKLYDLDPDTLYYTTNLASNADIDSLRKAAEVQKSRGMGLSQLKQMYIKQGYSKETAERMAEEDISERG